MNGFSRVALGRVTRYFILQTRTLTVKGNDFSMTTGINLDEQPPTAEFTGKNVFTAEASAAVNLIGCRLWLSTDFEPSRLKGAFSSKSSRQV